MPGNADNKEVLEGSWKGRKERLIFFKGKKREGERLRGEAEALPQWGMGFLVWQGRSWRGW